MIKVSNNLLNLNVQNLNAQSYNKISDLFLSILLNLINNQFSENQSFSENLSISQILNGNLNEDLNQSPNLVEKSYRNKELDLLSLYLFYLFHLDEKNLVSLEPDKIDEINDFQFNKENFLFIKKLISFLISHKEIDFSQFNQIFEKTYSYFNTENLTHGEHVSSSSAFDSSDFDVENIINKEEVFQILNISNSKNEDLNKEENLVKEKLDELKVYEFLRQIGNLSKIKGNKIFYIQNKENNQPDRETFSFYTNTFQDNNQPKIEENLNLQIKNIENIHQKLNHNWLSTSLGKKYINQNVGQSGSEVDFNGKSLNISKDFSNFTSSHNDLEVKKGEILKEEFKLYNFLERKFKMEENNFQKIFDVSLIKSDFRMENLVKVEHTKIIDFQKFPEGFLEMIKEMSLEIQPEGEKKAFIKLEPPEMGSLDLEIKVKDKNIEIIARVEKPELLQELKHNLHLIKAGLEDSGFNLKEIQLFLGSNFNDKNLVKDFSKEKRNYSQKAEVEDVKEIDKKAFKNWDLLKFYNRNGKYYYIV
uniref:Flagellar hook-length control protein FliK n=1 Tax=Thermodesulfobacterium geofontis TaxID=1295609 RepID=A0A7C4JRS9_9BACT